MTRPYRMIAITLVAALTLLVAAPALAAPPTVNATLPVEGTLEEKDGTPSGTFEGDVTLNRAFVRDGRLMVSGVLEGTATGTDREVTQDFTAPLNLSAQQQECDILFLDLGPIFLDLLGLQVDLSPITLDVDAVPGAGNLLGNLLCAITGLLDNPGNPLNAIAQLLNRVLRILS